MFGTQNTEHETFQTVKLSNGSEAEHETRNTKHETDLILKLLKRISNSEM